MFLWAPVKALCEAHLRGPSTETQLERKGQDYLHKTPTSRSFNKRNWDDAPMSAEARTPARAEGLMKPSSWTNQHCLWCRKIERKLTCDGQGKSSLQGGRPEHTFPREKSAHTLMHRNWDNAPVRAMTRAPASRQTGMSIPLPEAKVQ